MDEMDLSQFKEIFISEAKEHLVSLNSALVELEKNPNNKDMINQIFRAVHTLKGMSATMGYDNITNLSHHMEDVLDRIRKSEIEAKSDVIDIIFKCFDTLEKLVEDVGSDRESKIDISGLMDSLNNLLQGEKKKEEPLSESKEEKPVKPEIEEEVSKIDTEEAEISSVVKKSKTSIRINTSYLDTMMNLVGEMVISKSQLEQIAQKFKIEELEEALRQFDRIAIELQGAVLQTRMVTLSHIFDRYPRMMRDLSLKLEKDIAFEINGADIEIDRVLLDEINEPLVHLLRNAVDHGIETAEERKTANKSERGSVILSARRERGYISIVVKDDGKGLDPKTLRQKAFERNLITEETAKTISDEDSFMLICDPRFSTADRISDVSGRGVGMDVVKTVIDSVNGRLIIDSKKDVGSTFTINLPLTMAIISALLIKLKNEIYAIPINNITEIINFSSENVKSIEGKEVIVLRDEVLPMLRLVDILNVGDKEDVEPESATNHSNEGFILRVETGNKAAAVLIDNFIGRKEIVIKTLTGMIKRSKGFSGATILGDGSVVLIVDVASWL